MRLFRYLLSCCPAIAIWLLCLGVSQAGVLAVEDDTDSRPVDLTPYWSVLKTSPELTIEDILSGKSKIPVADTEPGDHAISLGLSEQPVWLKLQLRNDSKRELVRHLEVAYPHIDRIELYHADGTGYRSFATGRSVAFADRPFPHRHFIFPLTLAAGTEQTYYLRVDSHGPLYLPTQLWQADHFIQHAHAEYLAQALYFGMLLALGLYNLLLFVSLRDRAYLHYVLLVGALGLAMLAYSGIGHEFLWPNATRWSTVALLATAALACMALLSFARQLLRTPNTSPRLDKVVQVFIVLNALGIVALIVSYSTFLVPAIAVKLASQILALVMAIESYARRQPNAVYMALGMGVLLPLAVLMTSILFGHDLHPFLVMYSLPVGSAFLLLVLSLALANRFQQERRAKEKTQQQLLEDLKRSEQQLEQNVARRTEELVRSNRALQEHQQALAVAKQVAEEASRMKSQFLANVSHEIRTPMNAVIGMAHLALRTELTAQQRDYIDKIHRSAVALLGIMNDILDFSKIEAGKMVIEHTMFSLSDVINHVTNVTGQMAHDKELEYLVDIAPDVPRRLLGDPLRLGQVLINLVSNAIKFTQQGEVHLSCRVIGSEAGRIRLQFDVRDTGIGMTSEHQKRLFESFTQADSSISRKYGGTGLGLSISKRLVEMMGGSMMVRSAPRLGSTFSFTLHCGLVKDLEEPAIQLPAELHAQRMLIVDDNPLALKILDQMLKGFGLTPDQANNGTAALEAILRADATVPYDLVLTDVRMTGMDGLALIREIERSPLSQKPRIILLTATRKDITHSVQAYASVSGVLYKPLNPSQLLDCLLNTVLPEGETIRPAVSLQQHTLPNFSGRRVLLVEDNEINQQITREMLSVTGMQIDAAANGREALEKLFDAPAHTYDLVLMDIQMPELGGHATAQRIRAAEQFNDLPILALTAHATVEEREQCLRSGMQDHLAKPIHPDQLYHMVSRWLKPHHEARDDAAQQPAQTPREASTPQAANENTSSDDVNKTYVLPGFDVEGTLARLGEDEELFEQVLDMMLPLLQNALENLNAIIPTGDHEAIRPVVHNISGMAANVGAVTLSEAAYRLESSLKNQVACDEDIRTFCDLITHTINLLESRHAI